ncbi:hypothetical protein Tco_1570017, partial [Tanacetum coccineum]
MKRTKNKRKQKAIAKAVSKSEKSATKVEKNESKTLRTKLNSQVNEKSFNNYINHTRLVEIPMGGCLSVVALHQNLSNHCPIVLKDVNLDFGPRPFGVFDVWFIEVDMGIDGDGQEIGEFTVKALARLVEEKVLRVKNEKKETLWNNWAGYGNAQPDVEPTWLRRGWRYHTAYWCWLMPLASALSHQRALVLLEAVEEEESFKVILLYLRPILK